jgi:hypothetical protein
MRKLLPLLFILSSLAGAARAQCNLDARTVAEYDRYHSKDATWAVLIIPAKASRDCLVAYIRDLHRDNPDLRFEVFNLAAPELAQYVRWAANGMRDDYFYPEKWLSKHHVATLLPFIGTGPSDCEWTLEFEKSESIQIDRGRCHAPWN